MKFYKYQALGNDYIVINPMEGLSDLSLEKIRLICDRHFGIGSDGILVGPIDIDGKLGLKIYNPDGSQAQKSGNGLRIFSRYLYENNLVKGKTFSIQTIGGLVDVEVLNNDGSLIKINMGKVTFDSTKIPVTGDKREMVGQSLVVNEKNYQVTCLSIGNPHCVIPMEEISKELACKLGPHIESHADFPERINVQLLKVIDHKTIQIEIWERGAGYTLASGSSSCAAASAAYQLGLVDSDVTVRMPGGKIGIQIELSGDVWMTGSVEFVYSGHFSKDFWKNL